MKIFFTALLLSIATMINAQSTSPNINYNDLIQPKIVGGYNATRGEWPYIVALAYKPYYDQYGLNDAQYCSGTLIDKSWVLTAAHCAVAMPASLTMVAVGPYSLNNDDAVEHIMAKRVIIHPDYNKDKIEQGHDIALIELETPSKVTPAKIITDPTLELGGREAWAIGWGSTVMQDEEHNNNQAFPLVLQELNEPIIARSLCSSSMEYDYNDTVLCAGFTEKGKGTCQGDSGGPLFIKLDDGYYQAGIVSAGIGCGYGYYDLFANVATLSPFIEQYVDLSDTPVVTTPKINKDYSGSWYNTSRSGEGWLIQMLANNRINAYWFTYDKNNKPLYVIGAGDYDPNSDTVTLDAYTTKGARFGDAFNKNDVQRVNWGTMTFKFKDCNNATISYNGVLAGYGIGSHDVTRLTAINTTDCFDAKDGSDMTTSGPWYLPTRSGEGFLIEALAANRVNLYWFTYDLTGNTIYIYGVGNLVNGKVVIDAQMTTGTSFGIAFDAKNVQRINWGTVTIEPKGCNYANVSYSSTIKGYGSGSFTNLQKIAYIDGAGCQ